MVLTPFLIILDFLLLFILIYLRQYICLLLEKMRITNLPWFFFFQLTHFYWPSYAFCKIKGKMKFIGKCFIHFQEEMFEYLDLTASLKSSPKSL